MKHLLLILSLLITPIVHATTPANYAAAVANPARSDKDRERDLREHPAIRGKTDRFVHVYRKE